MSTITTVSQDSSFVVLGGIYPASGNVNIHRAGGLFDMTVTFDHNEADINNGQFSTDGDYTLTLSTGTGVEASVTFTATGGTIGPSTIHQGTGAPTMAIGDGRLYTATQRARTTGQRYFDIKGNGPSEATAIVDLGRKVALTHGSVVLLGRPRISVIMADADYSGDTGALGTGGYAALATGRDSTGEQENVQITVEQTFESGTINEHTETRTLRLQACSDIIKLAGTALNDVDPGNSNVAALVAAFHDSDGNASYQFRSGKFVR